MKRITALILSIAMLFTILPAAAYASATSGFKPIDAMTAAGGKDVIPGDPKPDGNGGVWDHSFQGFRIAVLDYSGEVAFTFMGKNYLDLLFTKTNISNMDYFGDGHKLGIFRKTATSSDELTSALVTIDSIKTRLDDGRYATSIPDNSRIQQAISKLSKIPKPFKLVKKNWVTYGTEIKKVFYGSDDKIEDTALMYVLMNLRNSASGKYLWQPKIDCHLGNNGFTTEELDSLKDNQITPIELMAEKQIVISIEPIIWNKLRISENQYSYGVYGTQTAVGGIIQWLEDGGWFSPSYGKGYGGYDSSLFGKVGRRSMVTSSLKLRFNSQKDSSGQVIGKQWYVDPPADTGQKVSNDIIYDRLPGWSLHVYLLYKGSSGTSVPFTHTFDYPSGDIPHPAPDPKNIPLGTNEDTAKTRIFNIIKTYRENGEHVGTYSRVANPGRILIEDEVSYMVTEWFISETYDNPSQDTTWEQHHQQAPTTGAFGTDTGTVQVEAPNTTLYVLLEKGDSDLDNTDISADITESQITKVISTSDNLNAPNWGNYQFVADLAAIPRSSHGYSLHIGYDIFGGHIDEPASCGDITRSRGDNYVSATFTGLHTLSSLEAMSKAGASVAFATATKSGDKLGKEILLDATVGDGSYHWSLNSDSRTKHGLSYFTTIWRGPVDTLTLAEYKKSAMGTDSYTNLKSLVQTGNQPVQSRASNGEKKKDLNITLGISAYDNTVESSCFGCGCASHHTAEGDTQMVKYSTTAGSDTRIDFETLVRIDVYSGEKKRIAAAEVKNISGFYVPYSAAVSSSHSALFAKQQTSNINFFPYVRMSYQITADGYLNTGYDLDSTKEPGFKGSSGYKDYLKDRTVYVLSDKQSSILPTNAVEVSWLNEEQSKNGYGIQMTSQQWSLHKRATAGTEPWQGINKVLPGGALYTLDTKGTESYLKTITYSTLVDDGSRAWMKVSDNNSYTASGIVQSNSDYAAELKEILDNFRIVQWVNQDYNLTNAWDKPSTAVKVSGGGQSLSNLGLSIKTSGDSKYVLTDGTPSNGALEADIDILSEQYQTTVYKCFTDADGNVYVAHAAGNAGTASMTNEQLNGLVGSIKATCGTNLSTASTPGITTGIKMIGTKRQNLNTILEELMKSNNDLYMLNLKTGLISNVINSVTRNAGQDTNASWATDDGKWYNEANDGIYVVAQTMTYKIGLGIPNKRIAALDPALCPPQNSKGDVFSTAFISQFRLDDKSTSSKAAGKNSGYLGTFEDIEVFIPDIENMFISRPFSIPNATVQDLS